MPREQPPKFFVPDVPPKKTEAEWYELLAAFAGRQVPPRGQRVYSVSCTQDGESWTFTVGETSTGSRLRTVGQGSLKREIESLLSDPAKTLAIFPGNPYIVVTDQGILRHTPSAWANPFHMGESSIRTMILFSDQLVNPQRSRRR